jgi:hypothetical protein
MAAPVLAVGDGALGFWKAVRDVFPTTKRAALLVALCRCPGYADVVVDSVTGLGFSCG